MKIFTFKQGGFTAFLRATLLLVMMFTSSVTFAQRRFPKYVSDVMLVGGTEKETSELVKKYESEGWQCLSGNLNDGCRASADHIYMLIKMSNEYSTNGGYITDFYLTNSSKYKETITYNGHTYKSVPYDGGSHFKKVHGDLLSNAGGDDIHLYYTKDNFADKRVVDDIWIYITSSKSDNSRPGGTKVVGNKGSETPFSLNTGGKGVSKYIYMFYRTCRKTNRPVNVPVFKTNLIYNGEYQQLIQYVPNNDCELEFAVDAYNGTYYKDITRIVAKEPGNHTVFLHALGNEYGDKDICAYGYNVTISKLPNDKLTVKVPEFEYGIEKTVSKLSLSGTNLSTGKVTYMFATSENGNYTTAVPTMFGLYYVKAIIEGDAKYETYTTKPEMIPLLDWEGKGTQDRPYVIRTTEDLNRLATRVNEGIKYKGSYFWLANDIVYTGTNNFTPIGGAANQDDTHTYFEGNFDGNGKTISGIDAHKSDEECGLFGKIGGYATVKNVTLSNCKFKGDGLTAALVGYCRGTVVNNVVKDVVVEGVSLSGCLIGDHASATVSNNLVINSSITISNIGLNYGVICGCIEPGRESTFINNYYVNCHVIKHTNRTVDIGTGNGDVTENDAAVALYSLTCPKTVEASTASTLTYGGVDYYVAGTKILVKYTGSKPREGNFMIDMFVNGEIIRGGKFVMPAQNATVTSKIVYLNFILYDDEITIDATSRKTDRKSGNKLYASGITVNLSYTEPDDKIFKGYVVNGDAITGNSFEMPNKSVTVSATWEQLYSLALSGNVTTSTPATKTGADGTKYYAVGTQIELTSTVDGELIKNFTVNGEVVTGNSFTMPAKNVVVSASLVQKKFAVKLGGNDLTRGSVTGDGEYVYGSTVTVTATAKEGYVFVGWMDENENIVSTEASYRFTATDNQRLTAVFKVDESTGIETVNAQADEDVWYTLNGHKLAGKPIQKGVYIHNNKKVIIK